MRIATMKGENFTGFSHDGTWYAADKDGFIKVPETAVSDAIKHGWKLVQQQPAQDNKKKDS